MAVGVDQLLVATVGNSRLVSSLITVIIVAVAGGNDVEYDALHDAGGSQCRVRSPVRLISTTLIRPRTIAVVTDAPNQQDTLLPVPVHRLQHRLEPGIERPHVLLVQVVRPSLMVDHVTRCHDAQVDDWLPRSLFSPGVGRHWRVIDPGFGLTGSRVQPVTVGRWTTEACGTRSRRTATFLLVVIKLRQT